MKTPVVESTGTGGGMKLFCAGVGDEHPDATNASRRMKKGEFEDCHKNGVTDIVEIKIGFDGLTVAHSKQGAPIKLTLAQIFLALAKEVPGPDGKLVANPNKNWSDIDAALPNKKIEVLGPPPTSGTRDSLHELVMEKGAEQIPALKALKKSDAKAFEKVWKTIREDGAYVEAGENDNVIVQKLEANPNAFGIFGYSFLEENTASSGVALDGVEPTYENIAARQVQGLASALHLRQEAACRRGSRHRRVRRGVCVRQGDRRGRLSRREGSRDAAEGRGREASARRVRAWRR